MCSVVIAVKSYRAVNASDSMAGTTFGCVLVYLILLQRFIAALANKEDHQLSFSVMYTSRQGVDQESCKATDNTACEGLMD